jgi:hypothetical protein
MVSRSIDWRVCSSLLCCEVDYSYSSTDTAVTAMAALMANDGVAFLRRRLTADDSDARVLIAVLRVLTRLNSTMLYTDQLKMLLADATTVIERQKALPDLLTVTRCAASCVVRMLLFAACW